MPDLNIMTWNSGGETQQGADILAWTIQDMTTHGLPPDVIVVQEANAAPGGLIMQMLAGLAPAYNPPVHAIEGGSYGKGYLLSTKAGITGQQTFTRADLGQDQVLIGVLERYLRPDVFQQALAELGTMHMPAGATLTYAGATVHCMTWHTPRDPGPVLGARLRGGANADAFLFLQNSGLYQNLVNPGNGNATVIAGDLNVTQRALNEDTGLDYLSRVLPGWVGMSPEGGLDHILGHMDFPAFPQFTNSWDYPVASRHPIVVSTVTW